MEKDPELERLKENITKFKQRDNFKSSINNEINAFNITSEIVGGVIVGVIIGVFLDKIFASKPLCLIICLCLGIIASGKTIWQKINNKKDGA